MHIYTKYARFRYLIYGSNRVADQHDFLPKSSKVFVKKSFLDKSTKTIFNNLEFISFHLIGKISYPPEKFYQNKTFNFPKTINYKSVKALNVDDVFPINLSDLETFQNLEELNINNHLNVLKPNYRKLPSLNKLKYLNFGTNKPHNENEIEPITLVRKDSVLVANVSQHKGGYTPFGAYFNMTSLEKKQLI